MANDAARRRSPSPSAVGTVAALLILLAAAPVRAAASTTTVGAVGRDRLIARYAQALRSFNPATTRPASFVLAAQVVRESDAEGLDARLVVALVAIESRWRPEAVSTAGAVGLGQIMPATGRDLALTDARDARANLHGTVAFLARLVRRYGGYPAQARYERALSAYNAGAGAVDRYDGIPPYPETQAYVRSVIALWRRLAGA